MREGLEDAAWRKFYLGFRDPEIARLNGHRPLRMPYWLFKRVVQAELRRGDRVAYAIYDEADRFLGVVELYEMAAGEATLGILLTDKARWGQGYGTAAGRAVLKEAFLNHGLKRVKLRTFVWNARARRAFEKAGFRLLRVEPAEGGDADAVMAVEREAWLQSTDATGPFDKASN